MRDNRINREVAESVLEELRDKKDTEFSSHDFIEEYCKQNEREYIEWLVRYIESDEIFKTAHSQIALFLAHNAGDLQPRYHEIGRRKSENVHGENDYPMWFEWVVEI